MITGKYNFHVNIIIKILKVNKVKILNFYCKMYGYFIIENIMIITNEKMKKSQYI